VARHDIGGTGGAHRRLRGDQLALRLLIVAQRAAAIPVDQFLALGIALGDAELGARGVALGSGRDQAVGALRPLGRSDFEQRLAMGDALPGFDEHASHLAGQRRQHRRGTVFIDRDGAGRAHSRAIRRRSHRADLHGGILIRGRLEYPRFARCLRRIGILPVQQRRQHDRGQQDRRAGQHIGDLPPAGQRFRRWRGRDGFGQGNLERQEKRRR